jgi:hypothetical protein
MNDPLSRALISVQTLLNDCVHNIKAYMHSMLNLDRANKIAITVSIGAIGISIAAYFHVLSLRKRKRILGKSQGLINMVEYHHLYGEYFNAF